MGTIENTIEQRPQRLAVFKHEGNKLFYVKMINDGPRLDYDASVTRNINNARNLHQRQLRDEDSSAMRSGFHFAIVNTDFEGWTSTILEPIFETVDAANHYKQQLIEAAEQEDYLFVGSHKSFIKGVPGAAKNPKNWNVKFNVERMKKSDVMAKVDFCIASLRLPEVPLGIYTACYLAVVAPDTHGPRNKNFGSYTVETMTTLFRFARNYLGKDLSQ